MKIKFTAHGVETLSSCGRLVVFAEITSDQAREIMFAIAEELPGPIWGKIVDEINEE